MKSVALNHYGITNSLLQSISVFHLYFDNSLAPAWISAESGYMLHMNKLSRQIWHIDEEYQYKHVYELFPKHIAEEFIASDKIVVDTCKPVTFVASFIRQDGSPGSYMVHKFLLPLGNGRHIIAGQAIDITEQVNMQEELKGSHERFSYVAKAVSDCIWDWDIETGHIYRSEALMELTGYTAGEIEGSLGWWEEKMHPKDRSWAMEKIHAFIKQGHPYCDAEYRFRCADNRYKYFLDKGYVIYRDGRPVRAIGVVHDITEKKRLEAKLLRQKVQKQKDISRAIIAAQEHVSNELGKELHDNVNQLLASVAIMLDYGRSGHCQDMTECLGKSRQYLQLAIDEIRKISKSLNTAVIRDDGLIRPVQEIIATMQLNRLMDVQFECHPELEQQLLGEQKLMIYRIIQEQTNNILKYADASEVLVSVICHQNTLYLTIRDNGKGFDMRTTKRGNGLVNIRNRAETFNGSLNIISAPGEGCSLEVTIPLKKR